MDFNDNGLKWILIMNNISFYIGLYFMDKGQVYLMFLNQKYGIIDNYMFLNKK